MCENQYFPCFDPLINNHLSWWNSSAVVRFLRMLPIRNISYLPPVCFNFLRKMHKESQNWSGVQNPLKNSISKFWNGRFLCRWRSVARLHANYWNLTDKFKRLKLFLATIKCSQTFMNVFSWGPSCLCYNLFSETIKRISIWREIPCF